MTDRSKAKVTLPYAPAGLLPSPVARDEWNTFRRYRRSETQELLLSIIAIFVAIFVAAALFVGPEIALARARVLGRWAGGIIFGLAIGFAFVAFVLWQILKFWQISREPDGVWLVLAILFICIIGPLIKSLRGRAAK